MWPARTVRRCLLSGCLWAAALAAHASTSEGMDERRTTVGLPARMEQLVLPGPELEAKPLADPRSPIVLRIVATYRHGSDFRYDLEYTGLEQGTFDLKEYLQRKDGSSTAGVPAIVVQIAPVLPPGQVEPHRLEPSPSPSLGGYRAWLAAGGVAWTIGLLVILLARRRSRLAAGQAGPGGVSLAERLRTLVDQAVAGCLPQSGLAELERLLLAHWRRRLGLDGMKPARAIATLRSHPEAGELLRQLERWLHRPGGAEGVDVEALLRPYQEIVEEGPVEQPATRAASQR